MARSMQLTVLAEGVETPEQQGWLLAEDCDQCQGYLLGRPMAAESFARHWQELSLSTAAQSGACGHPQVRAGV